MNSAPLIEHLRQKMDIAEALFYDARAAYIAGQMPGDILAGYRADYLLAASRYEAATRPNVRATMLVNEAEKQDDMTGY